MRLALPELSISMSQKLRKLYMHRVENGHNLGGISICVVKGVSLGNLHRGRKYGMITRNRFRHIQASCLGYGLAGLETASSTDSLNSAENEINTIISSLGAVQCRANFFERKEVDL